MIILGGSFFFYEKFQDHQVKKRSSELTKVKETLGVAKEEENTPEFADVDFEKLQKENQDVYAWIYIPGTKVNYPVLQNQQEPDYYLDHNLDGQKGYPACIYTQPRNQKDFQDPDTVIYGHNMKDGSMFGGLKLFLEREYRKKHGNLYIYTPDKVMTYELVGAYISDDALILNKYHDFENPEDFQDYLEQVVEKSEEPLRLNTGDRLITLSTCTSEEDQRLLVQFVQRKIEERN
ncbi:MAG: class B sortase [Lachnospiraceae bacterium]|nr:class B sortase [Lachnospiraceae bacterium]